jgi:hypothetical protein
VERVEVPAHEDRAAAPARGDLGEVARHLLGPDAVEARVEVVEPDATDVRVVEGRHRVGAAVDDVTGAVRGLGVLDPRLEVLERVAQRLRRRQLAVRGGGGDVRQPHLVLDVVVVEQRALEEVRVALPSDLQLAAAAVPDLLLVGGCLQPDALGQLEQAVPAVGRLELVEQGAQFGPLREGLLLGDDRQTEVDGQQDAAQGPVVLVHPVLDRGHHAVALAALDGRVGQLAVEAAPRVQLLATDVHAPALVGPAELLGDAARLVVEVTPAVGPQHVVQDHHGAGPSGRPRHLAEHPELVVHGEPVVVAIDQGGVHRRERRQHVVADVVVEDVAATEAGLVLGRVEGGHRIDHVQLGVRAEVIEHELGVLAPQGTDLHDPPGPCRVEDRRDHGLPEGEHPSSASVPRAARHATSHSQPEFGADSGLQRLVLQRSVSMHQR